jgi:UDP-glucose 4-epimerase
VNEKPSTALTGSRVLVTGASGLIGSHVVGLLEGQSEVVALSRNARRDEGGVEWLACDLAEPGTIGKVLTAARPEVVIHLAGAVRGDRSLEAVEPTMRTNLVATVELLEAATRSDCRRIVLSGSLLEEPAAGGPDVGPPSPYGASRWAASAYGRMFHTLFGAPVVILRPSFAYGPRQEPTKLIPHVITELLAGRSPRLSSGERLLDCVYAEDVAHAYLAAASASGAEGRTIDLGSGTLTSVREIVAGIVDAVGPTAGRPRFGELPVRPGEQQVEVNVTDAAQALGWRATTGLDAGLRATVAWFRAEAGEGAPATSP